MNKTRNLFLTLQAYLLEFESYENKVYKDSLGFHTVGIGHKLTKSDNIPFKVNHHVEDYIIQELFIKDIQASITLAKSIYPNYEEHTDNIRLFMVIQTFNMGNNLRTFVTSNPHLINFNYGLAYKGFINSKWSKQVHKNRASKVCNLLLNKVSYHG